MNISPPRRETIIDFSPSISPAPMDIRHLVFDMCASHDLKANGVYNVARRLAAEQLAAGENARIVFLREESREIPQEPSDVQIDFLTLAGRKLLGRRISMNGDILDAITLPGGKPLFFHVHAARQPMLLPVIMRLRKLGIPYAMTIHGRYSHLADGNESPKRKLSTLYLQHIEKRVLEGARFVQGVSMAECALIRRIAPRARVEFVPNAAYSSRLEGTPSAPQRTSPSPNFPVFGFLGRYEIGHKGLDLLIDGFAAYRAAGGKGRLELVGTGPARDKIAAQARELGVGSFVSPHGPRFGAEKARTLAAWDYFIMPSRFEGVPIGALEAGLAGLPLIVSAETGLREEVVQFQAGIGIATLKADAVAQALLQAENRMVADWARMSAAAHRMALSIGDWTAIAAKLVSLYRAH
jgi:glycosyltransferase involved in cell wall biosynthesis